jgi:iron(III) transport system substrate-binding protein
MSSSRLSRRGLLIGSSALVAGAAFSTRVLSAAPPPSAITPQLVAAAKKEGKVVWYTSIDLKVAQEIAKTFEKKYGVNVHVERTGAERLLQRIGQEYSSNIHAVDVVNSSDASHLVYWKSKGWLAPYVPEDVAKYYPAEHKDPDGTFASFRIFLCVIAYNTTLVKKDEAPKSFADLLLPKWKGKIVKAHPGYSGTILTATFQMSRDLGWGYFEKLAKQNVLRGAGRRRRIFDFQGERIRQAGRAGLRHRGHAADRRSQRPVQGGAESERGPPVPELLLYAGMPAGERQYRRPALRPSTSEGQGRPHAARQDQTDER